MTNDQIVMRNTRLSLKLPISKQLIASFCFIMFFSSDIINFISRKLMSFYFLEEYSWILTVTIIYLPLILLPFSIGSKINIKDFVILWTVIIFAFIYTLLIHPEYAEWYNHPIYSVSNYIIRPDRAIYAYFFIRLINDPRRILENLRIISYLLLIYGFYQFYTASKLGYWLTESADGIRRLPYDMGFGYDMMLPAIVFIYYGIQRKSIVHLLLAIIPIYMILSAGSRAPLLFITIYTFISLYRVFLNSRIKQLWLVCSPIIILILLNYQKILIFIAELLKSRGISTRSIEMFLAGTIADDNGRNRIYEISIDMIKDGGFWGYGLYGDRYVIGKYFFWGYPHNIILEILITFGLFLGCIIIIIMLYYLIKMLIKCTNKYWLDVFLIFLISSLKLMLSYSYWYVPEFWATIAVVYGWNQYYKNMKGKQKVCLK